MSTPSYRYELPTELWLEVFSSLDYLALMSLKATCKLFRVVLSAPENPLPGAHITRVDLALFRDKPNRRDEPSKSLENYILHPFLIKQSFVLRNGSCHPECQTRRPLGRSDPPKCNHNLLCISKEFQYYEDIRAFADASHRHLSFNDDLFLLNAISPVVSEFIIEFLIGNRKQHYHYSIPDAGSTASGLTCALHLFWAKLLYGLHHVSLAMLFPSFADSLERFECRSDLNFSHRHVACLRASKERMEFEMKCIWRRG